MVHALQECHRVLKSDGFAFDLRPASVHMKIGVLQAGEFSFVSQMDETFENDYAANDAIAMILEQGLFKLTDRAELECQRHMETIDDFDEWLADFQSLATDLASHRWLVRKADEALQAAGSDAILMATGPLILSVLEKQEPK